ncbi:hypothetical protein ACFL1T_02100 [Chlamydiota bacterium]
MILLQKEITDATILTDDGKAVKWLLSNKRNFISTPLVPVILVEKNIISKKRAKGKIFELQKIGYFSQKVIEYALDKLEET